MRPSFSTVQLRPLHGRRNCFLRMRLFEGGVPVQIHVRWWIASIHVFMGWHRNGSDFSVIQQPDPIIAIPWGSMDHSLGSVTVTDGIYEAVDSFLLRLFPPPPFAHRSPDRAGPQDGQTHHPVAQDQPGSTTFTF